MPTTSDEDTVSFKSWGIMPSLPDKNSGPMDERGAREPRVDNWEG